ncbi:MAG: N-acetylglutaminylglutamine amidotransferase [Pseudomonadota bacterium]
MCGIAGELRLDGRSPELGLMDRMLEQLERRGPDHCGSWSDGPLQFGHRRLSIIDLSSRSHQPMVDARLGLAVVFNGTIYNYPQLREELIRRGHAFFSGGDTEVILKAYAEWGEACVEQFDGMFAFAIWEIGGRRLFLARDRMGIKPLYYAADPGGVRFASNTQALLAGGDLDTAPDPVALHYQFTLHGVVPGPRTVVAGIRKLPPATTLTIGADGEQRQRTYWHLRDRPRLDFGSEAEGIETVHEALRAAVAKRRTVADVPVGVLLSGGLDSSLLVGLLHEAGESDLQTFSIGFEDVAGEAGSEFEYSDVVAERFGTRHHRMHIPNSEVLPRLPEAIERMPEPMFGQDAVAFYLLAERVSREVKVVLSGQGADEVFGGYFWYHRIAADPDGDAAERLARHYFDRDHDEYLRMVTERFRGPDHTRAWLEYQLAELGESDPVAAVLALDPTQLVVEDPVKRVDSMTMAWGLEARVPFLDHRLVETAAELSAALRLRDGGKHPLKAMARGLVPDSVIDRPKGYFPMPALKYVRGEFLEFMRDTLNTRAARERGIFEPAYIDQLLDAPEEHHTRIQGSKLWHAALFEAWWQRHIDR